MSRSFSAECESLGLSHLLSAPNDVLGQSISQRVKDFASHLRKRATPPLPHHQALDAVSCASGFPAWDSFVRATRRLEAQQDASDATRTGLCDALPLLVTTRDLRPVPAARAFEGFTKRIVRHTGYDSAVVKEALAQFWGAQSYQDVLTQFCRQESARFVLELDSNLVWPEVLGPLHDLLEDAERRAALAEAVRAAARRDAAKYAESLRVQLAEIDPAFPEQERLFVHAKRYRDLPWGSSPPAHSDRRASRLYAAYSYWAFCKDVAGKNGSRTWKQFEKKYSVSWRCLLEDAPLKTEVPCPACSKLAPVAVVFIPGKHQKDEQWKLSCSCGHVERKSSMIAFFDAGFAPDSALYDCNCASCDTRRREAMRVLEPYAKCLAEALPSTLRKRAKEIAATNADGGLLALGENGEVFKGDSQVGQYRERVFRGVIPNEGAVDKAIRERGGWLWSHPVSRYLERTAGFHWSVAEVHAKNLIELVFDWELKPHFPFYDITDGNAKHKVYTETRKSLDLFLAGFTPGDMASFRKWLSIGRRFIGRGWLTIPAVVSIAKSTDSLQVSPDIPVPPPPEVL